MCIEDQGEVFREKVGKVEVMGGVTGEEKEKEGEVLEEEVEKRGRRRGKVLNLIEKKVEKEEGVGGQRKAWAREEGEKSGKRAEEKEEKGEERAQRGEEEKKERSWESSERESQGEEETAY
ncbi:MAG: hypothetical protein U0Z75_00195 [Deinococcaceae bacterium]